MKEYLHVGRSFKALLRGVSEEGGAGSPPPQWVSVEAVGPDEAQLEESPVLGGVPQCRPRSSEVTTADQTTDRGVSWKISIKKKNSGQF